MAGGDHLANRAVGHRHRPCPRVGFGADANAGGYVIMITDHGIVRPMTDTILSPLRLIGLLGGDTLLASSFSSSFVLHRILVDSSGAHELGTLGLPAHYARPQLLGGRLLVGGFLVDAQTGADLGPVPFGGESLAMPDPGHGRFEMILQTSYGAAPTEILGLSPNDQIVGSIEFFPSLGVTGPGVRIGTDGILFQSAYGQLTFVRSDNIEN